MSLLSSVQASHPVQWSILVAWLDFWRGK